MPNYFEPIIGSSFDNIASQRAGWARFNEGVDSSNLDRAAQAQRTRNAYLAQLAKMQQDDADRQAQREQDAAALARQQGRQQYEDVESRRRFDIGTDLTKGQQDLERTHWRFNMDRENKAERKQLDLAENFGKAKSSEANDLGKKLDDATAAYNQSKGDLDKALSRIQGRYAGVRWDNKAKLFVSSDTKTDPEKVKAANDEFSEAKSEADRAAIDFSTAHEAYLNLQKEASSYGLTVQRVGNKRVLFSPAHNRFFGDAGKAPGPFESEFETSTSAGADAMRNPLQTGGAPAPTYAGFSSGEDRMTPGSRIPSHRWPNDYGSDSPYAVTNPPLPSSAVRRYNPATGLIE